MITLEEYKEYLINSYRYEIDNSKEKRQERRKYLEEHFSDEHLTTIINNTYSFINKMADEAKNCYYKIPLPEENTDYIFLNLNGGWFSDRLYIDYEGNMISEHILRVVFGSMLMIEVDTEENCLTDEEYDDGLDIVGVDYSYWLYIQGLPNNLKKIKEKLFGKSIKLKKD